MGCGLVTWLTHVLLSNTDICSRTLFNCLGSAESLGTRTTDIKILVCSLHAVCDNPSRYRVPN